jgi:PKD repeat protein
VAFDAYVSDITDFLSNIELSSDSYINNGTKIFSDSIIDITDFLSNIEFVSDSYISENAKVFGDNVIDITDFISGVSFTTSSYIATGVKLFKSNIVKVFLFALPPDPIDNTVSLVFGIFVDFTSDVRYGYPPLNVVFENLSVGAFDAYLWDFGDGKTSSYSAPTHKYSEPGFYTVTLSVYIETQWYTISKYHWILVWDSERIVSRTTRCFQLALNDSQGVNFSENTGDDFVFPPAGVPPIMIWDGDNTAHVLVFDNNDGNIYDMMTRDGPTGTGLEKIWTDKADINGENGTDIIPSVKFGEDVGNFEYYWIRAAIIRLFVHAVNDSVKGVSGFNDEGIPDALEITLRAYIDGKLSIERSVTDIPITGDIHFDDMVEGHRIALEFVANMGLHTICGRYAKYILTDKMIGSGVMSEDDYQEQFSTPSMWFSRDLLYIDRATGIELDSTEQSKITPVTGVEGRSNSAWSFTEALNLPSRSLSGASIILWHQGLSSLTINGVPMVFTDYNTSGLWTLSYLTTLTTSGAIVINPTGTCKIFDLRIIDSQILSTSAIAYYYDNVVNHSGDVVLP